MTKKVLLTLAFLIFALSLFAQERAMKNNFTRDNSLFPLMNSSVWTEIQPS